MTQAFNLSQFANNINTSGKADLTTAVTGTLPVANGGTGLSSSGAAGNVLQSNGSTWVSTPAGNYSGGQGAVYTGAIFTASQSGTTMTVTAVTQGTLYIGQTLQYVGSTTSKTITAFISGSGGTGTYAVSNSATISSRTWTGSATGSFTLPLGVSSIKVTAIGGGGNGGNAFSLGAAGGGGAGGSSVKYFTGLDTSGTKTINYIVGAALGTSSVSSGTQTISNVSATGGTSATTATSTMTNGGNGGIGSGGDLNVTGGGGLNALLVTLPDTSYAYMSGSGGNSILGGASRGGQNTGANAAGISANTPGAGGSGAIGSDITGAFGGSGAPGCIMIEW